MRSTWILGVAAGCAATPALPPARFANAPVVAIVDDRRDVPSTPESREFLADLYFYDGTFQRPMTRALELPRKRRALGVNALDDVPDSTWFTNRIGARTLTPDEIRLGPVTDDPARHLPWTIRSTKIGGTSIGFIIKDASGVRYLIKFDAAIDPPELETGTHVVVNRLLWACGYEVPEDTIDYIRDQDLVLAPDASVKNLDGDTMRPLDRAEFGKLLAKIEHGSDGRIRTMASRWIEGTTLGGHPSEGVRDDDPNDRIPHELRRDLRGQYAIYAWLDAVDVTEGQYVDSWVADRGNPRRHYVKHYAIDFGKSLGAMGEIGHDWWRGYSYRVDFPAMLRSLATGGAAPRPWQDRAGPRLRGVSTLFDVATFDPGTWHPDVPGYGPFVMTDRFDNFWGAKIVARFTREQLHAAVEAGRFTDPRSVEYLTDMLVARQRATAAYWFARVNPLDHFAVTTGPTGSILCFDDLAVEAGVATAPSQYTVDTFDYRARGVGARQDVAGGRAHVCTPPLGVVPIDDDAGYTILRIATARPGFVGETLVHLARDPTSGAPRVIGVWRP